LKKNHRIELLDLILLIYLLIWRLMKIACAAILKVQAIQLPTGWVAEKPAKAGFRPGGWIYL
jgi:hypothetical protein